MKMEESTAPATVGGYEDVDPEAARQAARRKGIGGSDAPAVLGISPFRSAIDVWADKLNLRPKEPENPAMRWGKLLEPHVASAYSEATGRRVKIPYPQIMRHREHSWMLGSIDRLVIGEQRLVELKTSKWDRGWGGPGTDVVPDDYFIQVQHYLAVTGYPVADCAVLIAGSDFRVYTIQRDDKLIAEMIAVLADFWQAHVLTGKPPAVDGSESCRAYLQARYDRDSGDEIAATPEMVKLALELKEARVQFEEAEGRKRLLENEIKAILRDASCIVGDDFRISWKRTADSTRVNWEAIAQALKAGPELVREHTATSAGFRRFLVTFNERKG
jgi:putative phage-type endonuclease